MSVPSTAEQMPRMRLTTMPSMKSGRLSAWRYQSSVGAPGGSTKPRLLNDTMTVTDGGEDEPHHQRPEEPEQRRAAAEAVHARPPGLAQQQPVGEHAEADDEDRASGHHHHRDGRREGQVPSETARL